MTRLPARVCGTSPSTIRWARPSTIAVLPTPASPISTGLFLVRRDRISTACSISSARPITGSISPRRASSVRSTPYCSRVGCCRAAGLAATAAGPAAAGLRLGLLQRLRVEPRGQQPAGRGVGVERQRHQDVLRARRRRRPAPRESCRLSSSARLAAGVSATCSGSSSPPGGRVGRRARRAARPGRRRPGVPGLLQRLLLQRRPEQVVGVQVGDCRSRSAQLGGPPGRVGEHLPRVAAHVSGDVDPLRRPARLGRTEEAGEQVVPVGRGHPARSVRCS